MESRYATTTSRLIPLFSLFMIFQPRKTHCFRFSPFLFFFFCFVVGGPVAVVCFSCTKPHCFMCRVRILTTTFVVLGIVFVLKQWPEVHDVGSHLMRHLKQTLAVK